MKLTIKTLQQITFKVDIDAEKTVKDLKDAIEKEQGKAYPYSAQKLIYNGKILTDETKLAEYEFDEKKFVVLMITRPPPAHKVTPETNTDQPKTLSSSSTAASSTSATATTGAARKSDSDDKSKQQIENKPSTVSTTPSNTTTTTTTSSSSATNIGSNQARSDSQRASQMPFVGAAAAALAEMSALSMGEPSTAARLASLMSQPQFRQMQDLIQQSPHLLSSTIESLAASDPEMYNFISENPDVFVNALNHPPIAGLRSDGAGAQQRQGGGGGISNQGGGGLGILGQQPVVEQLLGNVSEHDKAAIERLKELGFSEILAVQAYMACDKDEQLAANLLFQMDQ